MSLISTRMKQLSTNSTTWGKIMVVTTVLIYSTRLNYLTEFYIPRSFVHEFSFTLFTSVRSFCSLEESTEAREMNKLIQDI
jgi:hypothetical protein